MSSEVEEFGLPSRIVFELAACRSPAFPSLLVPHDIPVRNSRPEARKSVPPHTLHKGDCQ